MRDSFMGPLLFGLASALLVWGVLSGRLQSLIPGYGLALVVLAVLGMGMCATGGIGVVAAQGRWAQPLPILGYVLGAVMLVIIAAGLFGWRLPFVANARDAFIAVAGLGVLKVLLTLADRML